MVRNRKGAPAEPVYTRIGVKVQEYQARVEADINHDAKQPQYAFKHDDRDPLYKCITRLTIFGTATYPEDRSSQHFEITVSGDDSPSLGVFATLKDAQARGEYGEPLSREYRGGRIPVYRQIPGLGLLCKIRGEPRWTAWANVSPRLVSDMLILLGISRDHYLAIEERKAGRTRWLDGIGLQTTDPAED